MNKVVFAEPNNQEAKNLAADALEQLGYQSENGTWRNEYLMGAYELRNGKPHIPADYGLGSPDATKAMTNEMFLDYMGIRLDGNKAAGKTISVNWELPDTKEKYLITLENSVLMYKKVNSFSQKSEVSLTLSRESLNNILTKKTTLDNEIQSGKAKLTGDTAKFNEYMKMFDTFTADFNIVTP